MYQVSIALVLPRQAATVTMQMLRALRHLYLHSLRPSGLMAAFKQLHSATQEDVLFASEPYPDIKSQTVKEYMQQFL